VVPDRARRSRCFLTNEDPRRRAWDPSPAHLAPEGRFVLDFAQSRRCGNGAPGRPTTRSGHRASALSWPPVLAWSDASCDPATGVVTYGTHYKLPSKANVVFGAVPKIAFPSQERHARLDRRGGPRGATDGSANGRARRSLRARPRSFLSGPLLFPDRERPGSLMSMSEPGARGSEERTKNAPLEQDALNGAAEVAVAVGEPRGGEADRVGSRPRSRHRAGSTRRPARAPG
jgi:hypothetical protein